MIFSQKSKEKTCLSMEKILLILENRYQKNPESFLDLDHELFEILLKKIAKLLQKVLFLISRQLFNEKIKEFLEFLY